jgi:hypothetical protein
MYKGQIVEILPAAKVNKAYLGLLMAGVKPEEARQAAPASTGEGEVERVF